MSVRMHARVCTCRRVRVYEGSGGSGYDRDDDEDDDGDDERASCCVLFGFITRDYFFA